MAGEKLQLGTQLNTHPYLEFFQARTPDELKLQLRSVPGPYRLITLYWDGSNHVAWISPERKVFKVTKAKGSSNGS